MKHLLLLTILLLLSVFLHAQTITGVVTDKNEGVPIPGVQVLEKNTHNGTITNLEGKYSITVSSKNAVLEYSFIGYNPIETLVGEKIIINQELEVSSIELDEVIAIGYGSIKRSDHAGSAVSIKGENLENSGVVNLEQSLQGRLAGVNVMSTSGEPGAGVNITIRGASSISGGSQPLYVIDGIPIFNNNDELAGEFEGGTQLNMMASINPNDIESIEVLKDASATAIYGSRGANGVILISTKQGKSGKAKVDLSYKSTISLLPKMVDLVNAQEYAYYSNDFADNDPMINRIYDGAYHYTSSGDSIYFPTPEEIPGLMGEGTNWQKEIMQNAVSNDAQLTISGGNDAIRYYISGNYLGDKGLLKNTDFTRSSIRGNFDFKISDLITLKWNLYGANIISNRTLINNQRMLGGEARNGVISKTFMASPVNSPDQNNFLAELSDINDTYGQMNPLTDLTDFYFRKNSFNVLSNVEAIINISDNITFHSRNGINNNQDNQDRYWNTNTQLGYMLNGKSYYTRSNINQLISENYLSYDFNNSFHNINAILGTSAEKKQLVQEIKGFENYAIDLENGIYNDGLAAVQFPEKPTGYKQETSLISFYGRMSYSVLSKYLLTVTARADASSVFSENNKWAFFPSVGLGWNVHQEAFMKDFNWLSRLKMRFSYGTSGNQAISAYQSLATLQPITTGFGDGSTTSVRIGNLGNPNLRWETTTQLDLGMDIAIYKNRLRLTVDLYDKTTDDLLQNMPILSQSGFSNMLANFGSISNRGLEIELGGTPVSTDNFIWNIDVNYSTNSTLINDLGNLDYIDQLSKISNYMDATHRLRVGGSLGDFYGLKTDGLLKQEDIDNGYPNYRGANNVGDLKFVDQNKDSLITAEDGYILGNAFPDYIFGISNSFTYKNWSLSFLIRGAIGQEIMNWGRFLTEYGKGNAGVPTKAYYNDYWKAGENEDAYYPNPTGNGLAVSDRLIEDGSYIRLQNVTLRYNFPNNTIKSINKMSFYVSGNNLLLLTKYTGYDPEVSAYGQNLLRSGIDQGNYPRPRLITIGLDLSF